VHGLNGGRGQSGRRAQGCLVGRLAGDRARWRLGAQHPLSARLPGHATELETAARYGINPVTVVNNNFSLNQDMRPFDAAYGGRQHEGFEMWQFSKDTNLVKLAESLGCLGMCVDQP
jgi:Thiamine pyrophosphate enzyme, C-terminal TPP binding domain